MRAALIAILCGCGPDFGKPVRVPGYYPRPAPSYAQPGPAQQPRSGDHDALIDILGMWSYGNFNAPFYEPTRGVWTDPRGDDARLFTVNRDGTYELGHAYALSETGCKRMSFEWQRGTWQQVGNTITLRPAHSRVRVHDACDATKSYDHAQPQEPRSFSIRSDRDALTLYLPNGVPYSGPYYRVRPTPSPTPSQ